MTSMRSLLEGRRQARGVIHFPLQPRPPLIYQKAGRLLKKGQVVAEKPPAIPVRKKIDVKDQARVVKTLRPDVDMVLGQIFGDDLPDYPRTTLEADPDLADEMEFRREHDQ